MSTLTQISLLTSLPSFIKVNWFNNEFFYEITTLYKLRFCKRKQNQRSRSYLFEICIFSIKFDCSNKLCLQLESGLKVINYEPAHFHCHFKYLEIPLVFTDC